MVKVNSTFALRYFFKVQFSLGPGMKFAVSTYNLAQKAYKPSKVKLARDTNEEVITKRAFINSDAGSELKPSEINKFFMNNYWSKIGIFVKLMRRVSMRWEN